MKQWSILSNEMKYMHYSQHPIRHYALKVIAPEEGMKPRCTKGYK